MKLDKAWDKPHEHLADFKGSLYSVSELIESSKDLPVLEAPIDAFAMDYESPCQDSLISFAQHMKQVNESNLEYPVLLSPCGVIVDGRHRLIKSLVEGVDTIKFKRLVTMTAPLKKVE